MMRESEAEPGTTASEDGTLPIDFGDDDRPIVREVHVDGEAIVSGEAGEEHRLAEVLPHGQIGIEAAYARARPALAREHAAVYSILREPADAGRTFAQAEPNYRAGFTAGRDLRYDERTFEAIEAELRREYESSIDAPKTSDAVAREQSWARMRDEIRRGFQEARRAD